jgi:hypothetical protein
MSDISDAPAASLLPRQAKVWFVNVKTEEPALDRSPGEEGDGLEKVLSPRRHGIFMRGATGSGGWVR